MVDSELNSHMQSAHTSKGETTQVPTQQWQEAQTLIGHLKERVASLEVECRELKQRLGISK